MNLQTLPVTRESLALVASVPITFEGRSRLRVTPVDGGLGGLQLVEEPVDPPFFKDFDRDEAPLEWADHFDTRNWAVILARDSGDGVLGAATMAYDTPGVFMLEGRRDLTVLWDLRVRPEARGQGIGAALFQAAVEWSRSRGGVRQMKIESQNNNVSACRFYAAQGAVLGGVNCYAYYNSPYADETMLLWYKNL